MAWKISQQRSSPDIKWHPRCHSTQYRRLLQNDSLPTSWLKKEKFSLFFLAGWQTVRKRAQHKHNLLSLRFSLILWCSGIHTPAQICLANSFIYKYVFAIASAFQLSEWLVSESLSMRMRRMFSFRLLRSAFNKYSYCTIRARARPVCTWRIYTARVTLLHFYWFYDGPRST